MENATSGFNATPQAVRTHIAVYGRRNAGKSSLVNALAGQAVSLVSQVAGTTTDPVTKAIELHPIGPCLLVDTAGYDDTGAVGELRNRRTRQTLDSTDLAVLVVEDCLLPVDEQWLHQLRRRHVPVVIALNKADILPMPDMTAAEMSRRLAVPAVAVSATAGTGIDALRQAITQAAPADRGRRSITASLAKPGDTVVLVMPQDRQAPAGRLILPQAQTIRDLLDGGCTPVCCTPDRLSQTLAALSGPPALVITDSQVFGLVHSALPPSARLTSFSILMAAWKGNIAAMVAGARAIDRLDANSRVLIAEACAHAPLSEDIGREKIPALLRNRVGQALRVDIVSGRDFPDDLTPYDLIIHCGACMFNRRYMLSRLARAAEQGVPITNYGVALAHIKGILRHITLPAT